MPKIDELERGIKIDEHDLDMECKNHAELFYKVAKELALTISRRDEIKKDLEVIESTVDAEIRLRASSLDKKPTETQIQSQKHLDARVIKTQKKLSELNLEVGQWAALKESFGQRSYMLGHMTELYVNSYRGEISAREPEQRMKSHDADIAKQEMRKQRSSR